MARTPGSVMHTVTDHRLYLKPSLGKPVIRTRGVNRTSAAVLERNKTFASAMGGPGGAVVSCRGRPWPEFIACLKQKAREKGLGTGVSKTLEYRKRFWRHK